MAYGINAPFGLRPLYNLGSGTLTSQTRPYQIYASADGATTYNSDIFTGDPVVFASNDTFGYPGTIARYNPVFIASNEGSLYSTTPLLGVFQGCEYTAPDGEVIKSPYWPAKQTVRKGTKITAHIMDDPSVVYDIQVSSPTKIWQNALFPNAGFADAYKLTYGMNAALDIQSQEWADETLDGNQNPGRGNMVTGLSGFYLSGGASTVFPFNSYDYIKNANTLPLKIIGLTQHTQNVDLYNKSITSLNINTTIPFLNVSVLINNHVLKQGTTGTLFL